jgi:hypothetical protein
MPAMWEQKVIGMKLKPLKEEEEVSKRHIRELKYKNTIFMR